MWEYYMGVPVSMGILYGSTCEYGSTIWDYLCVLEYYMGLLMSNGVLYGSTYEMGVLYESTCEYESSGGTHCTVSRYM